MNLRVRPVASPSTSLSYLPLCPSHLSLSSRILLLFFPPAVFPLRDVCVCLCVCVSVRARAECRIFCESSSMFRQQKAEWKGSRAKCKKRARVREREREREARYGEQGTHWARCCCCEFWHSRVCMRASERERVCKTLTRGRNTIYPIEGGMNREQSHPLLFLLLYPLHPSTRAMLSLFSQSWPPCAREHGVF